MESRKTKILLDKYWEGKTTLEEEQQLDAHFAGEIPSGNELAGYSTLFQYRKALREDDSEQFDLGFLDEQQVDNSVLPIRTSIDLTGWKRWAMIATVAIILAVASVTYQWPRTQTLTAQSEEMERAYTETLAALQLVAEKLNEGNSSIRELRVFDETTKQIIHEK